jgi:CRISPR/Cas system-associated exonuclease Cas4 (RecB family)
VRGEHYSGVPAKELSIHGIKTDFGPEHAETFRRDLHPDLRADSATRGGAKPKLRSRLPGLLRRERQLLADPPLSDSDTALRDRAFLPSEAKPEVAREAKDNWSKDDVHWQFGVPPKGNANFAWVQHFNGRIDLVRRIDTGETTIVDLKSSDRAQPEDVTETQLHIYALGYRELTGRDADQVEIYELDDRKRKPRSVDQDFIDDVKKNVKKAADALRSGALGPDPHPKKCSACDYLRMCSVGLRNIKSSASAP